MCGAAAAHEALSYLYLSAVVLLPLLVGAFFGHASHVEHSRKVGRRVEEHALGGLAVAPRSAALLVIGLYKKGGSTR